MKKIIHIILVLLLFVGIVNADVELNLGLSTTENILANFDLRAGGDITINGISISNRLVQLGNIEQTPTSEIITSNYELFMIYDVRKRIFIPVDINDLDEAWEIKARAVWDAHFVPRTTVYKMFNYLQNEIDTLKLELRAVQEIIEPTLNGSYDGMNKLCDARLKVAKMYNLTSIKCDGITYYNHIAGSTFIGISKITTLPIIMPREEVIEIKTCEQEATDMLYPYNAQLQLRQLITIYKREDWRARNNYMLYVNSQIKEAYEYYVDCEKILEV